MPAANSALSGSEQSLSRSLVSDWKTQHLVDTGEWLRGQARQSRDAFEQIHQNVRATDWSGDAKDAAVDQVSGDVLVADRQATVMEEAATIADDGAHDIQAAKRDALEAIQEAEDDGFRVAENLSVSDTRRVDLLEYGKRRMAMTAHAETIQWRAGQLVQTDALVGRRLAEKAAELDGIRFENDSNGATVQAVDFHGKAPSTQEMKSMTDMEIFGLSKEAEAALRAYDARWPKVIPAEQYPQYLAGRAPLEAAKAAFDAQLASRGITFGPYGGEVEYDRQTGAIHRFRDYPAKPGDPPPPWHELAPPGAPPPIEIPGASASKTDRIKEHLTDSDLDAARRELNGEVVARKPDGTPWDHVQEVRDAQTGLVNRIEQLKRILGDSRTTDAAAAAARSELSEASRLLDYSEQFVPRL